MTGHWSELVTAALVGTDRRPYRRGEPGAAAAALPPEPAEGPAALLADAAALALYRRAGVRPVGGIEPVRAADPETRPTVGRAAAVRLAGLLGDGGGLRADERFGLVVEWLDLARGKDLTAAAAVLPDLLDAGSRRSELRGRFGAVGGERARWLAGQRPDWSWYGEVARSVLAPESTWDEGLPADRIAYLRGLRATDPDRARDLLAAAWPGEPPPQRAAFLAALRTGLAPADEPFLEAALDDRRKEVRSAAAALLAVLPGSAYRGRALDRMAGYVRVDGGEAVVVMLPAQCDPAMARDGIDARAPQGIGERVYWFEQAVARTPLEFWSSYGDPARLLDRPVGDELAPNLRRGWAQAAVQQGDPDWAAALTGAGFGRRKGGVSTDHALILAVYEQLRPADAMRLASQALTAQEPYAEYLLSRCPRPWPDELSQAVLHHLAQPRRRGTAVSTVAEQAMLGMPPDRLEQVRAAVEKYRADHPQTFFGDALDRLVTVLNFRYEMHQEFQ